MQENSKADVLCDTESQAVSSQDFASHVVLYPLTLQIMDYEGLQIIDNDLSMKEFYMKNCVGWKRIKMKQ